MRRCGEQTNELHISRRERKRREERKGGEREDREDQEGGNDDRDREEEEEERRERRGRENDGGKMVSGRMRREALCLQSCKKKEVRQRKRGTEKGRKRKCRIKSEMKNDLSLAASLIYPCHDNEQ